MSAARTLEPASRFVVAQSWWLASELARRNPRLVVWENHPGGGLYDCLAVVDGEASQPTALLNLNREGTIHLSTAADLGPYREWSGVLSADGPHVVVKALERAVNLRPAPRTTRRSLSYRVIARVLASLVDDRCLWDARSEFIDSSGMVFDPRHHHVDSFPSALAELASDSRWGEFSRPWYQLWALTRANEAVAILDTKGVVHTQSGARDMMSLYRKNARNLSRTIGAALGDVLP